MNDSPEEKSDARRLVEAASWRTRLWENDLESTPDFELWLSDSGNRQAWDRLQRTWKLIGEHATSPELLDLRRRALGKVRGMGRQRWARRYPRINRFPRVAIAAGFLILAAAGAITFHGLGPNVYRTGPGERRVVTLADGSEVQLDSLTELRVDYSEHVRELKLIKGQARFDVARDLLRPFWVVAAGRKVVALGTAFNVDLLDNDLFVTLLEGKVVILPQVAAEPRPEIVPKIEEVSRKGIELKAGEQLAISAGGTARVAPASLQRATAWQDGQLVFEDEPLSTVVDRVSRYSTRPVRIADQETASQRISGVFNTNDIDGFITTVTHYLPIKAIQGHDAIYLSARSAEKKSTQTPGTLEDFTEN